MLRAWMVAVSLSVSGVGAQTPVRPYVPPDYPGMLSDRFPPTLPHTGVRVTKLAGDLLVSEPAIGRPSKMVIQGRRLWVGDHAGDPYLHVIDLDSGRLVRSLGRAGQGPGDFRSVAQLSLRPGDTSGVWVFDLDQRRLTRVPSTGAGVRTIIQSGAEGRPLRMGWLSPSRLLVIGLTDSARVVLADATGAPRTIRPGPLLGRAEIPMQKRINASNGLQVCVRPEGDTFGIGYVNAARVELYDGAGGFLALMRGPAWGLNQGDFVRNERGEWGSPPVRYYYRGCYGTSRYYYGLFAGRTEAAGPEGTRSWDSPYVHVFDWTGTLRNVLELDEFAEAVAVDGDSVLYAGGGAMEGIYKYRLPPGLILGDRP